MVMMRMSMGVVSVLNQRIVLLGVPPTVRVPMPSLMRMAVPLHSLMRMAVIVLIPMRMALLVRTSMPIVRRIAMRFVRCIGSVMRVCHGYY